MADSYPPKQYQGLSLGQAALVASLGLLVVTIHLAEPVFMLWLLIKGWRIPDAGEPAETFGTA
jgi:hypothetical protein